MQDQGSYSWGMMETGVSPHLPFLVVLRWLWLFTMWGGKTKRTIEGPKSTDNVPIWLKAMTCWLLYKNQWDLEDHKRLRVDVRTAIRQVGGAVLSSTLLLLYTGQLWTRGGCNTAFWLKAALTAFWLKTARETPALWGQVLSEVYLKSGYVPGIHNIVVVLLSPRLSSCAGLVRSAGSRAGTKGSVWTRVGLGIEAEVRAYS